MRGRVNAHPPSPKGRPLLRGGPRLSPECILNESSGRGKVNVSSPEVAVHACESFAEKREGTANAVFMTGIGWRCGIVNDPTNNTKDVGPRMEGKRRGGGMLTVLSVLKYQGASVTVPVYGKRHR